MQTHKRGDKRVFKSMYNLPAVLSNWEDTGWIELDCCKGELLFDIYIYILHTRIFLHLQSLFIHDINEFNCKCPIYISNYNLICFWKLCLWLYKYLKPKVNLSIADRIFNCLRSPFTLVRDRSKSKAIWDRSKRVWTFSQSELRSILWRECRSLSRLLSLASKLGVIEDFRHKKTRGHARGVTYL